jgi:sulfide:quinone oxidoreductase
MPKNHTTPSLSRVHRQHVVIAGGGVAGLEAMIALRHLARDRFTTTILSSDGEFSWRALRVQDAFAGHAAGPYRLPEICSEHGAAFVHDTLVDVEPEEHRVTTRTGQQLSYDALVVAVGACRRPAFPGGAAVSGPADTDAMHGLIQDVEGGYTQRIAFIVPPGLTWPLPLYELALMTAERAASLCLDVALTVVTAEQEPLGVLGRNASSVVNRLLRDAGIAVRTATRVRDVRRGAAILANGEVVVRAQRVVAVPRLAGPAVPGLPSDAHGFVPVDDHCRVLHLAGVWAAGDVTSFPMKQDAIAAQQADVAARSIATHVGVRVAAEPFQPMLRGRLRAGRELISLSESPPTDVAAHLSPYLDELDRRVVDPGELGCRPPQDGSLLAP